MNIISSLIESLKTGLSIWDSKEKTKYLDEIIKLEGKYYEEYNKDRPDMGLLDNITFRLQLVSSGFSTEVGKKNLVD